MPPKKAAAGAKRAAGQQTLDLGAQKKPKADAATKKDGGVQQKIDAGAQKRKPQEEVVVVEDTPKPVYAKQAEVAVSKKLPPGETRTTKSGVTFTALEAEEQLHMWDLDMKFGPCMSATRLERWERAHRLKMSPPADVKELLEAFPELVNKSILHGRVHETMAW